MTAALVEVRPVDVLPPSRSNENEDHVVADDHRAGVLVLQPCDDCDHHDCAPLGCSVAVTEGTDPVSHGGLDAQVQHADGVDNLVPARRDDATHIDIGERKTGRRARNKQVTPMGAQGDPAPVESLYDLHWKMGFYARIYFDLQQTRVAVDNRLKDRGSAGGRMKEKPAAWFEPLEQPLEHVEAAEHKVHLVMVQIARRHPVRKWIEAQKGIGLHSLCLLVGVTHDLHRFETVSKLWAYLGMSVVDGYAPRRAKGEKLNYSPRGRVVCRIIAKGFVRSGQGGIHRKRYEEKKAEYAEAHPDWTRLHVDNAAMRYAVKCFLRDLWIEWHRVVPVEPFE